LNLNTFAETRGFSEKELDQWGVRVDGETVIIPTVGRDGPWYERIHRPEGVPKYQSPKGVESHLYNPLGLGPHSPEVWIAEGEFDTLSLVTVGAPAVGILGTGNFRRVWSLLYGRARIVLALDPDSAGRTQADKMAQLWGPNQVTRFDPSPYEDLNDWFKDDRAGFRREVLEHE